MSVIYRAGDATLPNQNRPTIIAHVVNDVGAWGKGFVIALGQRYPWARSRYKKDWRLFRLGMVQWVGDLKDGVSIANMFAQRGVTGPRRRIRYGALRRCLTAVFHFARCSGAVVHMPRVGCGLGGGSWHVLKDIVETIIRAEGTDVVVFGGKRKGVRDASV